MNLYFIKSTMSEIYTLPNIVISPMSINYQMICISIHACFQVLLFIMLFKLYWTKVKTLHVKAAASFKCDRGQFLPSTVLTHTSPCFSHQKSVRRTPNHVILLESVVWLSENQKMRRHLTKEFDLLENQCWNMDKSSNCYQCKFN